MIHSIELGGNSVKSFPCIFVRFYVRAVCESLVKNLGISGFCDWTCN